MNPIPLIPQTAPTWRDALPAASARPRPINRTGRRRAVVDGMRLWLSVAGLGVSLIAGYVLWGAWKDNPATLAAPVQSAPLREIAVRSDGVLNHAWVERTLGIAPGTGLMSLDLADLRDRLLQTGQVRTAVVTRRFPDVLGVTLEERGPVLRVRAQNASGELTHFFVARDGSVFTGERYAEEMVNALPWLDGATLTRSATGTGFARLDGMDAVADLLGTLRGSAPARAKEVQAVSIARFARDGVILVRTPEVAEVVFGTREDFYRQIARLDYILDELRARPGAAPIRSINLAIGGNQVPVSFETPPEPAAPARRSSRSTPATPQPVRTLFRL
ncbi:MAG: FtsQ-type POTRA domain-containing protein [Verrucomicrobia bacterium]|nr:FtsQ-type POTRA domain-containing protein [Verrucomicrobiota bacterium]